MVVFCGPSRMDRKNKTKNVTYGIPSCFEVKTSLGRRNPGPEETGGVSVTSAAEERSKKREFPQRVPVKWWVPRTVRRQQTRET